MTPVTFNTGRTPLLDCTTIDTCDIQFRSEDATTTNLTDSSIVSTGGGAANYGGTLTLTARSINCKGALYGWDSIAIAIAYTNLQQTNTLLTDTMDAVDALESQIIQQTAGQGFLLEYFFTKCRS